MNVRGFPLLLPSNRVWRTYIGGRTLDTLEGRHPASDSHLAEDWIASTTRAVNPGRDLPREGISPVFLGQDPTPRDFAELLAVDPVYFLGAKHAARLGAQVGVLVKYLDSGVRLHFQVHPTRDFARRLLNSPSGKTEAYHILAVRPEQKEPYIYVGFQRPPTREELRRMIEKQDIAALEACFDKIPVRPGETYLIPGGTPHALGEGVFMVEIQEPTDLVVRCEFEKCGYVLPEAARFMNRGLEFCLDIFSYEPLPLSDVPTRLACPPRTIETPAPGTRLESLIGPDRTDCFRVDRLVLEAPVEQRRGEAVIVIVTEGTVDLEVEGRVYPLNQYDRCFLPAGLGSVRYVPRGSAMVLQCLPPAS